MTETELRQVLSDQHWSLSRKPVKRKIYLYAVRRISGGGREEIYLCPLEDLASKSVDDIVSKLAS